MEVCALQVLFLLSFLISILIFLERSSKPTMFLLYSTRHIKCYILSDISRAWLHSKMVVMKCRTAGRFTAYHKEGSFRRKMCNSRLLKEKGEQINDYEKIWLASWSGEVTVPERSVDDKKHYKHKPKTTSTLRWCLFAETMTTETTVSKGQEFFSPGQTEGGV